MPLEKDYSKEKKAYRKRYQKFKQTQDCSYLDENLKKPKKKKFLKTPSSYKDKQKSINLDIFLLTVKRLLQTNQITKNQLIKLIENVTLDNDKVIFENARFSNGYTLPNDADRKECREYWLYLMRNNQLFCDICGNEINTLKGLWRLTFDHIIPESKGGKTNGENASPAHLICNNAKTDYLPEEWEIIGPTILKAKHIRINLDHCLYQYRQLRIH